MGKISRWSWILAGIVFGGVGLQAQERVTCESQDGRRVYCSAPGRGAAVIERQLSRSECIEGRSWGIDRRGLWVDRGCRAVFRFDRDYGGYPGGPGGPGGGYPGGSGPNWIHPRPGDRPGFVPSGNWNGGNWGRGGACFYTQAGFGGDYFCMRRGESFPNIGGYGDRISSIRVFGGARVEIFNDRDFRGGSAPARRDIGDLRNYRFGGSHTWNNRISSVQVR